MPLALLFVCLVLPRPAPAEESVDWRSIIVEAGYDNDETKTWYIDAQLGFHEGYWMQLAGQKNDVESDSGPDLDSRSYFMGFGHDSGAQWSYGLLYENWGNPGDIETNALRATITWVQSDWVLSFIPQYRKIELEGTSNGDDFSFNERGLGAGVEYSGFGDWLLYLEYHDYNFSRNPDRLEDVDVLEGLTFTATSLASGFYDRETVLGVGYWLNPVNITLQYTRDKSAIDNGRIKTTETHLDYYPSDNLIPYLRIGRASFPGVSPLWFGNIGLQIVW
jgi:hypothetical protein